MITRQPSPDPCLSPPTSGTPPARPSSTPYSGELAAGHTWPCLQRLKEALCRDVLDAYRHLAATGPPDQTARLVQRASVSAG